MRSVAKERNEARIRRHRRVRKKISGTGERPRLCVFRSLKHIYAQVIDDSSNRCLVSVSSNSKEMKERLKGVKGKQAVSTEMGKILAEKAKAGGIESVAFDRGGYLYHGRVKALADAAREAGLSF